MMRPRNYISPFVRRPAFTLIEMLAVISIIALLATFLMFAMFGVQQEAKAARTKAQISKLHEIVMEHYDAYQYRPAPIRSGARETAPAFALRRRNAIFELMRRELPDRITDVRLKNTSLSAFPALSEAHRSVCSILNVDVDNDGLLDFADSSKPWTANYEGAECLYSIVANSHDGIGPALDNFTPSEIGDVDGDGRKEIVDAWGRPIEFLRWAPEYESELQPHDAAAHHDPFDALGQVNGVYALFPLIYSAGKDKAYGIDTLPSHAYASTPNPYGAAIGTVDNTAMDNITNHYQEAR